MLTPEQLESMATTIIYGREQRLVREIRDRLIASIATKGRLTTTDLYQVELLAELNREELTRILQRHARHIDYEIREQVAEVLQASHHADVKRLAPAYGRPLIAPAEAGITAVGRQAATGIARMVARRNLAMVGESLVALRRVADRALVDHIHGAKSTDRILAEAVRELSADVGMVRYKSGVRNHVDVAIRRILYTETVQANNRMTQMRLNYWGHDLVVTSSHAGSRPDHYHWQGQVFSLTGRTPGYETLEQGTDYGSVTGLAGANCRHTFHPWFEGDPLPERYMDEAENERVYTASQKQREYERAIRQTKRDIAALESAGADSTTARLKLGADQKRIRELVRAERLPRQPLREKAYGIGSQPRALTSRPVLPTVPPGPKEWEPKYTSPGGGMKLAGKPVKSGVWLEHRQSLELMDRHDSLLRAAKKKWDVSVDSSRASEAEYYQFFDKDDPEKLRTLRIANHSGSGRVFGHEAPDWDLRLSSYGSWTDVRKEALDIFAEHAQPVIKTPKARAPSFKVGDRLIFNGDEYEVLGPARDHPFGGGKQVRVRSSSGRELDALQSWFM